MPVRYFFLGADRLTESAVTLSFDHWLEPRPDRTVIVTPVDQHEVDPLEYYQEYGIDVSKFELISDQSVIASVSSQQSRFSSRGYWIRQQLLKLAVLESSRANEILIQDCDTFAVSPYSYFYKGRPVLLVDSTEHPQDYYEYVRRFADIPRMSDLSFVSEFMPYTKTAWDSLKNRIESVHQRSWLEVITDTLNDISNPLWFSEYELLGSWMLWSQQPHRLSKQHRRVISNHDISNDVAERRPLTIQDHQNFVCFKLARHTNGGTIDSADAKWLISCIKRDTKSS